MSGLVTPTLAAPSGAPLALLAAPALIPYLRLPSLYILGQPLHPYTYLVIAGMTLTFFTAQRRAQRVGLHTALSGLGLFWVAIGGFTGAHVVDVLAYHPERLLENPFVLLQIWEGLSSFGGFMGGAVALWLHCRRHSMWMAAYTDAMVFGFAPGFILARAGCFAAHDHPGWHSTFFLAVDYPGGPRHDLGFYGMLLAAAITITLYALPKRAPEHERFVGFYTALVLAIYAPVRFAFEFLRANDARYLGLTPAQYFSVGMAAIAAWLFLRQHEYASAPVEVLEDDDATADETIDSAGDDPGSES